MATATLRMRVLPRMTGPQGLPGPQGDQGPKGDPGTPGAAGAAGPANTLTIGTVVAGAAAAATITGNSPNQTLNLTLPQGLPISGLGTGVATFLGAPSSANLRSALTDETGTGAAVFADSPALTGTPTAPTATSGTNTTQLATTAFVQAAVTASGGGDMLSTNNLSDVADVDTARHNINASVALTPEKFGAVGDGSTDDATALGDLVTAALAAASATNAVRIELSRLYATSTALAFNKGNIKVIGVAPGAGFKAIGTGAISVLGFSGTTVGNPINITANYTYGTSGNILVVNTIDTGAGNLAAGDFIQVLNATGVVSQDFRGFYTQIWAVTGTGPYNVVVAEPVPFSINSSLSATIQKITALSGVHIEGIAFDGVGNTGSSTTGLWCVGLTDPVIKDLTFQDFDNISGAAVVLSSVYGGVIDGLRAKRSGNIGGSNAIVLSYISKITDVRHVIATEMTGSGIGLNWCSGQFTDLQSHLQVDNARNIKFFGCCGWIGNGIHTTGGDTAIAIESGSSDFIVNGAMAIGAKSGWWSNGTNNRNYIVNGFIGKGCTTADIAIGANAAGGSYLAQGVDSGVIFTTPQVDTVSVATGFSTLNPYIPLRKVITASFSGTQNNYAPTGLSGAGTIRLLGSSTPVITGLQGGWDGRQIWLINVDSTAISISSFAAGSSASNQFSFAKTLAFGEGVLIQYDGASGYWRPAF